MITFFNHVKGKLTLQLSGNMTISQMTDKYSTKIEEPREKFGKSITYAYLGQELDPNSNQLINSKLKIQDTIYISYKDDADDLENQAKLIKDEVNQVERRRRNYSITTQNAIKEVKTTLNNMALIGNVETINLKSIAKKNPEKFISINDCLESGNDQYFILGIMAKYLQNIGIDTMIEKADVTKDDDKQSYANTLLQFICSGYLFKNKYSLNFGLSKERIEQLEKNEVQSMQFHNYLKKLIAKSFDVEEENLLLTNYKNNNNEYSLYLIFTNNLKKQIKEEDLLEIFKKQKNEFKKITSVKKELILETISLNQSMLDSRGNNKDDKNWGYNEMRGGEPYNPPVGCQRYGLRVFGKYDDGNNDWLSYDNRPGEWCIAYRSLDIKIQTDQINYENEEDWKTRKRVRSGVCCYTDPKLMIKKTGIINVNGTNYKMGLMMRVKPDKIRRPKSDKRVWILNGNPEEIRPYGILLKICN